MVTAIIGAIIGTIWVGGAGGSFLFGASWLASVFGGAIVGMSIGNLLEQQSVEFDSTQTSSPTYSFGPIQNSKTQKLPIPIVYGGPLRVAGNIFYEKFQDSERKVVYRYIGVSSGEIESISEVKGGDQTLDALDGCEVHTFLTSDSETVAPFAPTDGPRPYPNKLAFVALKMTATDKLNGSSVITMIVKGRKVWTPDGIMWTDNPAWIIRDILTDKLDGCGIAMERIDEDSFLDAAQYYGEIIPNPSGGIGPRFTLSYIIDSQDKMVDHIAAMLSACRSMLICREKISLYVDRPIKHSVYKWVDESNIVEGSFSWWQSADEEIINRAVVEWIDPENSYEQTVTIFEDTADIESRGIIEKSFSLLGITRRAQAARMGAYLLDSAQNVKNFCSFSVSLKDADIEVLDTIAITNSLAGWNGKSFRVIAVTDDNSGNDAVTILCSEYVQEIYNDTAMDVPEHIDTSLQNPFNAVVSNFHARQENTDIVLTWDSVFSFGFSHYALRRGENFATAEIINSYTNEGYMRIPITQNGKYVFWISVISVLGEESTPTRTQIIAVGLNPPTVPGFMAVQDGSRIDLQWNRVQDINFSHYEIKEGLSWDGGIILKTGYTENSLSVPIATERLYGYSIKAVNILGNYSETAAYVQITISDLPVKNVLVFWRDLIANWTTLGGNWVTNADKNWLSPLASGTFENTCMTKSPQNWNNLSGNWVTNADKNWLSFGEFAVLTLSDGAVNGTWTSLVHDLNRVVFAKLSYDIGWMLNDGGEIVWEVRTSEDNTIWSEWNTFTRERSAKLRYIQYRIKMTCSDGNAPVITHLYVEADMPDIIKTGRETVPIGGLTVNYGFEFAIYPTINATADGAERQVRLVGTPNYADCVFKVIDGNNNDVGGVINWTAIGY